MAFGDQRIDLPGLTYRLAQRATPVGQWAGAGLRAAADQRFDRQAQPGQHPAGGGHIGAGHLFKIQGAQPFGFRQGLAGINVDDRVLIFGQIGHRAVGPIQQRLGRAFFGRGGAAVIL